MNFVRLLGALFLAAASPGLATESAPPPPANVSDAPDAEALAAALALFEGSELEERLMASALHMTKVSIETEMDELKARNIEFPDALTARLSEFMFEETRKMVEEITPTYRADAAAVYARYFTAEELRELKRLQDTPVMKKAGELSPVLLSELGRIGMKVAAARMPEIQRKGQEVVEQWLLEEAMADPGPGT